MTTPNFSPIATSFRKQVSSGLATRKGSPTAASSQESARPKYQCPGCKALFVKWSPCLAHLREKQHVRAELLDKRLNGGDFRRVQEICATLAYHNHSTSAGGRDRTDSLSSYDSLSSDSGGEEDESSAGHPSDRTSPANRRSSLLKQGVASAKPDKKQSQLGNVEVDRPRNERLKRMADKPPFDIKSLDEKIVFRILTFLDVESSRMLFLAITFAGRAVAPASESRVRLWSMSSDAESSSVPSSSPPAPLGKRVSSPLSRS